jgi:sec-independent protein translocase protein TatB
VFGMSMGEILILLVVGIVVVGPKNLPSMMRTAGQWISKIRRMSTDLRSQSGIDELIRQEGLEREIQEIRSLSRVNVIDTFISPVVAQAQGAIARRPAALALEEPSIKDPGILARQASRTEPLREREYPLMGCDAFDAQPEDATPYPPPAPDPVPEDEDPEIVVRESDAPDEASDDVADPAAPAGEVAADARSET